MAAQPGDPEALHLYQLIGAPLLAVVQAEAQAAQTSADFIKRVGFDPGKLAKDNLLQDGDSLGDLKMAKFDLNQVGPDGVSRPHVVTIPVLSLFPIPLLQIKHAEFDFGVRIITRVPLESPVEPTQPGEETSEKPAEGEESPKSAEPEKARAPVPKGAKDYLAPSWVELKGMLAPQAASKGQTSEMNLRVKVRMEQADIPAGLIKLLSIMDQAVAVTPKPPAIGEEQK